MFCPVCTTPLYDSGHIHPDCPGRGSGCQECGWGCDLDFVDDGFCADLDAQGDDGPPWPDDVVVTPTGGVL